MECSDSLRASEPEAPPAPGFPRSLSESGLVNPPSSPAALEPAAPRSGVDWLFEVEHAVARNALKTIAILFVAVAPIATGFVL
jgi:hypothetical protein